MSHRIQQQGLEERLGRIRKDGGWDRRYKAVQPLPPYRDHWQRTCLEIVIGVPLLLVLILGIPFLLWLVGGTP